MTLKPLVASCRQLDQARKGIWEILQEALLKLIKEAIDDFNEVKEVSFIISDWKFYLTGFDVLKGCSLLITSLFRRNEKVYVGEDKLTEEETGFIKELPKFLAEKTGLDGDFSFEVSLYLGSQYY